MANPPGGPLSGGMEPVQNYAQRDIQEKKAAQQQQPVQREQQPPQEQQSSNRDVDKKALVADAIQKNLEQNERVKEARVEEAKKSRTVQTPEKQALAKLATDLAPKEDPNRDQQQQQKQQQRGGGGQEH